MLSPPSTPVGHLCLFPAAVGSGPGVRDRSDLVAGDRAGHAPRPAAAGAELGAGDRDDLDAGLLEPGVGLDVALVGDRHARRDREGVVAVVPLLALGGDRVEAGVDLVQGVDLHRLGGGHQERLGVRDAAGRRRRRPRRDRVGGQVVGDVGVHHDLVDVDHRAHGVEVHGGALLRDGYGEHGVRGSVREDLAGQPLDARGRRTLADADGDDARRQQQHVAALEVLAPPAVDLRWCRRSAGGRCRSARSAGSRARAPASPAR